MPNPSTIAMEMEAEAEAMNHKDIIGTPEWPKVIKTRVGPDTTVPPSKGEVRVVDPKTGGAKGQKEAWLSLIPPLFKDYLSQVYRFGAKKYTRDNYLRGYNWSLSYDAMQRHIDATLEGEWLDDESGLPHLAHAAWHCATLILFHDHKIGTDDRIDFTGQNFLEVIDLPDADETVLKGGE